MRVTAWMMVCDPPEQSAQEIQSGLRLSAAAVSTATRQLIAGWHAQRVSRRGDRRIYYRLASGGWDAPLQAKLRALSRLRLVAERGIHAAGKLADYRLVEMRDAFAWFEDQMGEYVYQRALEQERRSLVQPDGKRPKAARTRRSKGTSP